MDVLATVVVLSLLLALAAACVPSLAAAWDRAMNSNGELEMWRVMRRRGLVADDARVAPVAMAQAIRRCQLCPSADDCRAWLASGRVAGTEEFCPNERFFESLDSAPHR